MRNRLGTSWSRRAWYFGGAVIWLGSILAGMSVLAKHDSTPGVATSVLSQWPQDSQLSRNDHGPTLVMFAHPRCPCTRNSLAELRSILVERAADASCSVVFLKPADAGIDWMNTDQVSMAESIPGVHVVADIDGVEAKRFNATTSGHTVVYDRAGKLVFSGGITMSRGHQGESAGQQAVKEILAGKSTSESNTPVFGCSMRECKPKHN